MAAPGAAIGPGEGSPIGPLHSGRRPPAAWGASRRCRHRRLPHEEESVRTALALFGGMAISAAGVAVVVGSTYDGAGVLLIVAGVLVAGLGMRLLGPTRSI